MKTVTWEIVLIHVMSGSLGDLWLGRQYLYWMKKVILRVFFWSVWRVSLILTALDLRLAHFDEAAGELADVAGSDSRNHYQHNFPFLMTCNPFPSLTLQSSDSSWYWELLLWVMHLHPGAQAASAGFSALLISFIATELRAPLASVFGLCASLRPKQRGVWILVHTWTDTKDNLEVKHGWAWETRFYKCYERRKWFHTMMLGGAGLSSTVEALNWKC